jgi:hypothetical protein
MTIESKFGIGNTGAYFNKPHFLVPIADGAATFNVYDSASSTQASTTVAFFTQWAADRGTTDTSNWTADTYKTIYNNSSGRGRLAAYIGCTAGGNETHTVEVTIDGVLKELAFSLTSGQRLFLGCFMPTTTLEFTTASAYTQVGAEAINAAKTGFTDQHNSTMVIPSWRAVLLLGIPLIRYDASLLIRAKHSASITNSTATAYSAVMHIAGL